MLIYAYLCLSMLGFSAVRVQSIISNFLPCRYLILTLLLSMLIYSTLLFSTPSLSWCKSLDVNLCASPACGIAVSWFKRKKKRSSWLAPLVPRPSLRPSVWQLRFFCVGERESCSLGERDVQKTVQDTTNVERGRWGDIFQTLRLSERFRER